MRRFYVSLIAVSLLVACGSSKKATSGSMSSKDQKDGWISLFDGKSFSGWHTYNQDTVTGNWKVVNGTIEMDPNVKLRGNSDLTTNENFTDYEFVTEWRIAEGGNSGILFNVKEDPKIRNTYSTGPEMQVLDNIKAADNKKENHLAGLLYDMSGTADLSKPKAIGEWNSARIIQKAGHLTLYFNDVKTADVQQGSDEWKTMIQNSKFKDAKDFALTPSGKIAFQNHGAVVAFRNIRIRKL